MTFRLPGCDGAIWSPVGGVVCWLATVAVTVFLASTVPESLTARTSKVWLPFATDVDGQKRAVTERGISLGEDELAVDTPLDLAGVVLDLVAVGVVDGTPVTTPFTVAPFAIVWVIEPADSAAGVVCVGDGGGDGVLGEHGAGAVDGAHLEGVAAVRNRRRRPEARVVTERDIQSR